MNQENNIDKLRELIADIDFTMMTTVDDGGSLFSRPMVNIKASGEAAAEHKLWFFTKKDSPKVRSLRKDQHVNLSYVDAEKKTFVSVTGQASLVDNQEQMQRLWSKEVEEWFPDGFKEDELALIEVEIKSAEYWDSQSQSETRMIGMATAFGALGAEQATSNKAEGHQIDFNH